MLFLVVCRGATVGNVGSGVEEHFKQSKNLANVFNTVVHMKSDSPVININYSRGLSNVFNGEGFS